MDVVNSRACDMYTVIAMPMLCLYSLLKVDRLFWGDTVYYNIYCIVFVLHTCVYVCGVDMFSV